MDRSWMLKAAGVAVLSVLVGILASTGNEAVLVNLLVVLTGVLVMWKHNQEVVTEASSKAESNVQTQPEVTYPQVPSTSKENEEVAASAPEKACSDCKELPDNSNILAGRMKEADTKCENGPEPATAVTGFYFGTSNVYQPCDKCRQRVRKEEVSNIFGCDHSICIYCIRSNFRYFTESPAPGFLSCPVCHRPDIFESKTFGLAYLSTLIISVEKIFNQYEYQKFKEVLQKVVTFLESIEQEVVTEASSKTESNVQTQPEVTYRQVPSTSNENEDGAALAPEKAFSDCKELPDNSNILVGQMKEAAAKCEDAPEPVTTVSHYYFGTFNVNQSCDKCFLRLPKEKVSNIFGCDHSICIYCLWSNFRYFTESQAPGFLSCPVCHRPDIFESKTFGLAYLSTLIISVEKILNQYEYQKFKEVLQKVVTFLESIEQEVVAEASSKTESNVQTQPEVTYPQVPSTSKENEEVAASAPEKACSDCKELPDISNILVGRMKEADAKCENSPEPATAVTGTSNVYQPCDKSQIRVRKEEVPVSKNSKSTKNKHLDEKNVYSESGEVQTKETLSNRKKKQSKGKNAYLDNSEVQKKENFSKMESKQPKELSEKLMLEAQLFGTDGFTGTTADNDKYWPKLGSRLNKNSTDLPGLGSFCFEKPDSNVCASKFSSAISSRNSLNDYVEKRQTTCPNCRVHCDLTRQVSMWVVCYQCKGFFCGICKAYYNNGCGRSWCFSLAFHLHHHEICYYKRDIFGIDKLKLILKANKVDFVDTEPVSVVCLLREVYHCQNKPFRSDLCRYHYEDYLANLVLQNNLKTPSNWF